MNGALPVTHHPLVAGELPAPSYSFGMLAPYQPDPLPLQQLDLARLVRLIGPANAAIARYDGLLRSVANPDVLLSPLVRREAERSSRIEGTQATVDEVMQAEAGVLFDDPRKVDDIQEIMNYRQTLVGAVEALSDRPLTLGLVREMHATLMDSVRGQDKTPGNFRDDQNWIGRSGCTIAEASFLPPSPLQLQSHLEEWIRYLDGHDAVDLLVQCAVMHAQFELLHPFRDGNGRLGRLLIPLFLHQKDVLGSPTFYLSSYLEEHREEYYERLAAISRDSDWDGWIEFFLRAVRVQALENTNRVHGILSLYEGMKQRVQEITRSQHTLAALDAIFHKPVFSTAGFAAEAGVPAPSAASLLKKLRESQDLQVLLPHSGRRPAILAFGSLINLAEGRELVPVAAGLP